MRILYFQSTPAGANKMREANLGTPPSRKAFQKQPQKANLGTPPAAKHFKSSHKKRILVPRPAAKHFKKNIHKKGAPKKLSAPQYLHFAAQQTCITSN